MTPEEQRQLKNATIKVSLAEMHRNKDNLLPFLLDRLKEEAWGER